ncbi:MAG TPA: AzlC family ABC transporter permease [Nocardioidaceae bacterium]|nr:AzlC family ABC transporter permease [Nocardioidaceae bacterium]
MVETRRDILRDALAVGVATGAYGISFGAIAVASGLTVLQACALSALVFTGASQFAFVGVVAAGGAPLAGTATALLLGSRNTLYGLRLTSLLGLRSAGRVLGSQLVIDESTAMAVNRLDREQARLGFFATGLSVFVLWNLATVAGALGGQALGDPRDFGLDAAVGAAFLALLWPRLSTSLNRRIAAAATVVAVALVPAVPAGVPVLAAAGTAVLGAVGTVPWRRR